MTFRDNINMLPGNVANAGDKTKINQLESKINALQQTVTTVADAVSSLSNSVTTNSITAALGEISSLDTGTVEANEITTDEITSDTASVGTLTATTETVATVNATTVNASSVGTTQLTASSANVSGTLGASTENVQNLNVTVKAIVSDIEATSAELTSAEIGSLEITGDTVIRGDVTFPEDGDEISGENLVIHNKSEYVKDLITETPTDTNNLVGYDNNGKLIPVDGSLDPSNLWKTKDDTRIEPKNDKIVSAVSVEAGNLNTDTPIKSLKHISYDANGKLVPSELKLSSQPHNAITEQSDGLYAPQMRISEATGQAIESKSDGIFVQKHTAGSGININDSGVISSTIPEYEAGQNINITENGIISATDTTYTAGNNITISNENVISCDLSTMNFRGSKNTFAELPASGQIVGDVWNVVDIATNYCWNGSEWIAIGSSVDISGLMNKDGSNQDIPLSSQLPDFFTGLSINEVGLRKYESDSVYYSLSVECLTGDEARPVRARTLKKLFASFINTQSATATKILNINGITDVYDGFVVKVCFTNGHNGTTFTLNGKTVKVNKNGSLIAMPYHTISGTNKVIQPYTTLEMFYSSTNDCWVVMGNPEVISYTSTTTSYVIKANGFIRLKMQGTSGSNGEVDFSFPTPFSDTSYGISAIMGYTTNPSAVGFLNNSSYLKTTGCRIRYNGTTSGILYKAEFFGY